MLSVIRIASISALAFVLSAFAFISLASSKAERLVVVVEKTSPYANFAANGREKGFSIEILEQLANDSGYQLAIVMAANHEQSLRMLERGRADISTLLPLTDEQPELELPAFVVGQIELNVFSLTERRIGTPKDLAGLRVGVVAGSLAIEATNVIPHARLIEFAQTDDLVVPLLTGEVDAVVSSKDQLVARLGPAKAGHGINILNPPLMTVPQAFLVSPNRPDVHDALSRVVENATPQGDQETLQQGWFGQFVSLSEEQAFWTAAGAIALTLVGVIAMRRRLNDYRSALIKHFRPAQADELLMLALDKIRSAIILYDKDMRAIHRNAGFAKAFPTLARHVDEGLTMAGLIELAHRSGVIRRSDQSDSEIKEYVANIISAVQEEGYSYRTVHSENGHVYEARDFRVGDNNYASVRLDVTDRYRQQETIRQQAEGLQRANERLETFSNIAAHDMRSPLRGISALVSMAIEDMHEMGSAVPLSVRDHVGEIKKRTEQLSNLVDDLLLYARAGTKSANPELFNPVEQLRNAVNLVQPSAEHIVHIPDDMPEIYADPTAFEAVMRNLISNALEHHDRGDGVVEVVSTLKNGQVILAVIDDGPGIPDQYRDVVFEPFQRLGSGGTGLGLAYVKKTVEDWGGTVSISAAQPRGSAFTLTIPTGEQQQPQLRSAAQF